MPDMRVATCGDCIHAEICKQVNSGWFSAKNIAYCKAFKDHKNYVLVVRCKDCVHAELLDRNCELAKGFYMHCKLWRGDEVKNVWHKYKKYYKDYSIVEHDDFCSYGERKDKE